jgi:4-hydroxy-2-oxoheptanedioate aldolase
VESAYQISLAALDAGIAPLVRVPNGDLRLATRCLDGGALGIVMPHVDTVEEARAFVDACRFPESGASLGHRSIAGGYPQFGFAAKSAGEAMAAMNASTLLVVMLETPRAIDNAAAIAAVPGIDVLLIGTNDLCLEMGIAGQLTHERVIAAYESVIKACAAHSKWPGMGGVYAQDLLKRYIGMGMRMILCGNDLSLLMPAAQGQAAFVRGCG